MTKNWINNHVIALITIILLAVLQGWIIIELNGHLWELLTAGCIESSLILLFTPAVGITWIGRRFAEKLTDDK